MVEFEGRNGECFIDLFECGRKDWRMMLRVWVIGIIMEVIVERIGLGGER